MLQPLIRVCVFSPGYFQRTGHLEFATPARAHLLRVARMSEARGTDFAAGQLWAEPDAAHTRLVLHQLARGLEVNSTAAAALAADDDAAAVEEASRSDAGDDVVAVLEWRWRYDRLAVGVRRLALRAQRDVLAQYNRDAVARVALARITAIADTLSPVLWPIA